MNAAEMLLNQLRIEAPIVDPHSIALRLGLNITNDNTQSQTRQRFECAMKIGEFTGITHEIALIKFAADLLTPKSWIRAYRTVCPEHILYQVFGVSQEMMKIRLEML